MQGVVQRELVGAGTKSERVAVVLRTPEGTFILRRAGGNAFSDPALDELVGQRMVARGERVGPNTFVLAEFDVLT
jgi:hypothetical protein